MLLTNDAADLEDLRKFIENDIKSVMRRGPNTRLMILSGCHGSKDGKDGISHADHLGFGGRAFYEEICCFFGLKPEGIDPRTYQDSHRSVVSGVSRLVSAPEWGERLPQKFPESWKDQLNLSRDKIVEMKIQVLDVAWFHGKIDELRKQIMNFEPNLLVIDWCFNNDGFTARYLKSSGLVSNVILKNEEYLLTRKPG